jgi:hypothetical protein
MGREEVEGSWKTWFAVPYKIPLQPAFFFVTTPSAILFFSDTKTMLTPSNELHVLLPGKYSETHVRASRPKENKQRTMNGAPSSLQYKSAPGCFLLLSVSPTTSHTFFQIQNRRQKDP